MGLFRKKLREVLVSIMPIIIVVSIMAAFVLKLPWEELLMLVFCIITLLKAPRSGCGASAMQSTL